MPSHGVDIIDGIPVILKGSSMFAFQPAPGQTLNLQLGTYDEAQKKATWTGDMAAWLQSYKEGLVPRSRK